jgi:hypothetical protein
MYDFEIDSIQDLRDFLDLNRDLKLKKDRNIVYFAVPTWTLDGVYDALQMIQNRPCWNYEQIRATIMTYFCYHQEEMCDVRKALLNTGGDKPVVICRIINLEGSLTQIRRKYQS